MRINLISSVEPPTLKFPFQQHLNIIEPKIQTIHCGFEGYPKPTVTWFKNEKPLNTVDQTLTLIPSQKAVGVYKCVGNNSEGSIEHSVNVTVVMIPTLNPSLIHTHIPTENTKLTIDCPYSGDYDTVWLQNDKIISNAHTLIIPSVTLASQGIVTCIAKNLAGEGEHSFDIDVQYAPRGIIANSPYPNSKIKKINSNFFEVSLMRGDQLELECKANGKPNPKISWIYDGVKKDEGDSFLYMPHLQLKDSKNYTCIAENSNGNETLVYIVSVFSVPIPVFQKTKPKKIIDKTCKISVTDSIDSPTSSTAELINIIASQTLTINCDMDANPKPKIFLTKNGQIMTLNRKNAFKIEKAKVQDSGVYHCQGTNIYGSSEIKFKVEVSEKFNISIPSNDIIVGANDNLRIKCVATGNPIPLLYWFYENDTLLTYSSHFNRLCENEYKKKLLNGLELTTALQDSKASGRVHYNRDRNELTLELIIPATHVKIGKYWCKSKDFVAHEIEKYVQVNAIPKLNGFSSSNKIYQYVNDSFELSCPFKFATQRMWYKDNFQLFDSPNIIIKIDGGKLEFKNVQQTSSGVYMCLVENDFGNNNITWNLHVTEKPPEFETVNYEMNVNVDYGKESVINCRVKDDPSIEIVWTKKVKNSWITIKGEVDNFLVIDSTKMKVNDKDESIYQCVVTNKYGLTNKRVFKVNVNVTPEWTLWSQWTVCDKKCGLGKQSRNRSCVLLNNELAEVYNLKCDGNNITTRRCKNRECVR